MAIDPRISLAVQPLNIGTRYGQVLKNLQQQDLLNTHRDLAPLQQQQAQMQVDLLAAQQPAQLQQAAFASSPESQLNQQQQQAQQIATSYATAIRPLLNNPQALIGELQRQKAQFQQSGVPTQGIDEDIIQAQTPEGLALLTDEINSVLAPERQAKSVTQREYDDAVSALKADPKMETIEGRAAAIKLSISPRAVGSGAITTATQGLTEQVAASEGTIAGAKESEKLTKQLKFQPQIEKAVKLAEKAATEQGDVLTDLARMEASLPGIKEVFSQLVDLSSIATSTIGGRAFDFAVKESGFGSTKGADARAKLVAIVDNQVLPLLRDTFGAAFTEREGETLKASLVNPDASPSQKRAQLDAFISQKERNVRTKQAQIDRQGASGQPQVLNFDAQGKLIQ